MCVFYRPEITFYIDAIQTAQSYTSMLIDYEESLGILTDNVR